MTEWQLNVYKIFTVMGFMIIMIGFIVGITVAGTASDYFGTNTKQARDDATKDSPLQDQLVSITSIPRWLEPLIFLGVAMFMLGIALEFSTIPEILSRRGGAISGVFPKFGGN